MQLISQPLPQQSYELLYCAKDVQEIFIGRGKNWASERLAEVREHHKILKKMPVPVLLFAKYYGYPSDWINERVKQLRGRGRH